MTSASFGEGAAVTAAIVVGFFPNVGMLSALLLNLSKQVDRLFLIDNGGCKDLDTSMIPCFKHIVLDKNYGLGYALNLGFSAAIADGAEYVATFDQDSVPPDNLISTLLIQSRRLDCQGISCAAIGPMFFDHRVSNETCFPFYKETDKRITTITRINSNSEVVDVDVLITSGMLIKSSVWKDQLAYDEAMFLDYTDTDWCFRARSKGYRLFGCTAVKMGHALSDAPPVRLFGLNYFRYSAVRRYYYFRNTILFIKKPYVSFVWKRRLLIGLILRLFISFYYENDRLTQFTMMFKGLWSGLTNRTGPYRE